MVTAHGMDIVTDTRAHMGVIAGTGIVTGTGTGMYGSSPVEFRVAVTVTTTVSAPVTVCIIVTAVSKDEIRSRVGVKLNVIIMGATKGTYADTRNRGQGQNQRQGIRFTVIKVRAGVSVRDRVRASGSSEPR